MSAVKPKLALLVLSFVIALPASVWFLRSSPENFPLDDAYIHLGYARSLASGAGFSFNPGEHSFGTTSPLWVFALASAVSWINPYWLALTISFLSFCASLFLSSLIIFREAEQKNWARLDGLLTALFPALFLVSFGNYLWLVFSGMETALWVALILAAVYFSIREKPSWIGYLFLGLAGLCRMESLLLVPVAFFWQIFNVKDRRKVWAGNLAALLIAFSFYVYAHFALGSFFPVTRSGKLASDLFNSGLSLKGGMSFMFRHIAYIKLTQPQMFLLIGYTILVSAIWIAARRRAKFRLGKVGAFSIFALLVFAYHDQFFRSTLIITPYHNMRYQVLFFPALALGLMRASMELISWSAFPRGRTALRSIFLLIVLLAVSFSRMPGWRKLYRDQSRHIQDVHLQAAKWCKQNLPPSARIACFDIGSLRFLSGRYVIDLGGLVDPGIAPYLTAKQTGPYLKDKKATHYIELGTPGSERVTGVEKDAGKLYQLTPMANFAGARIQEPVLLHSWEMKVYKINWIENKDTP